MRLITCLLLTALILTPTTNAQRKFAEGTVPPPKFADPQRKQKLAAAFPEIEKLFLAYAKRANMPGAVMGVIIDGELAWGKTTGVRETTDKAPVTPDTVFRIASMTKSFTALAILKLRDEGKLSLDDPAARYVPALAGGVLALTPRGPQRVYRRAVEEIDGLLAAARADGQPRPAIFAQVSFSETVRLKTGFSVVESGSVEKYPWRSNWKRSPGLVCARSGSTNPV